MSTQQSISFRHATLFLLLVFAGYHAGSLIATFFADALLVFGAGFLSSCGNLFSIVIVLLLALFMAKPLDGYMNSLAVNDCFNRVLIGFLGFALLFLFIWGWERYTQDTSGKALLSTLNFGESVQHDFWLIVGIVLTGPLLEELVFRWLFYTTLRGLAKRFLSKNWAIGVAAVTSSILFVSIHGAPEQLSQTLPLLVMGLVFALIFEVTNALFAVFVAHSLNNALTIYMGLADIEVALSASWLSVWLFAAIALGVILIALLHFIMKIKMD